jgi:hypothetical protein
MNILFMGDKKKARTQRALEKCTPATGPLDTRCPCRALQIPRSLVVTVLSDHVAVHLRTLAKRVA